MKTLCPAVLGLEALALLLAIPVLLALTGAGDLGAWAMASLAVAAVVVAAVFRRAPRPALLAGWVLQVLTILTGLMVPAMFAVGVMFAALWWSAVHVGGKVDRLEAARTRPTD